MRSAMRFSLIISVRLVAVLYSECARWTEGVGVEVRLPAELPDSRRDQFGVALLLSRVLQELGGDGLGIESVGGEGVLLVAQHADELGRQAIG